MDFKSVFLDALISDPKISAGLMPEAFLGQTLPMADEDSLPFFKLLSCGTLKTQFPWSFDIRTLDCFLFLYTKKGRGKLLLNGQIYSLDTGNFILLDCSQRFRMDIAREPWEYVIAFFDGNPLPHYRRLFPIDRICSMQISPFSDLSMGMDRLCAQFPAVNLSGTLMISDLLNHMTTICLSSPLKEEGHSLRTPAYIEKMQTLFDQQFQNTYTLDDLEKLLGVSKYKLCREFGAAYGISPLQYLNRQRIEAAKHLLLTTNHRIHVIGSMVGIENTNHFIFLFKKYTGNTPLEYKQRMVR